MNRAVVGMAQPGSGWGLTDETGPLVVGGKSLGWEELECGRSVVLCVEGFVDDAPTTLAKLALDVVVGNGFVDHDGSRTLKRCDGYGKIALSTSWCKRRGGQIQ